METIKKSLARVAKKQSPDDIDGFVQRTLANIETTTDGYVDLGVHVLTAARRRWPMSTW